MHNLISQFRRIYSDDGRDDKKFNGQEERLRHSLHNLKLATENLIRASNNLHDTLLLNKKTRLH